MFSQMLWQKLQVLTPIFFLLCKMVVALAVMATGFGFSSSGAYHTSIVILKKHSSVEDYINSIIHEAEHVKQAMLSTYMIEDKGEPPAYTIGYLVMRMWRVFRQFLCI